jgi:RNA polymerase sigma-70 factor (sigma-E family)
VDLLRRDRARVEFERFVTSHLHGLLQTSYLMVSDWAEAEDLVQECLLRVARRWPKVRTMKHPGAYARRVLVNLTLDGAKRRTRSSQELEALDGGEPPATGIDQDADAITTCADASELLGVLRLLPVRQRVVLVLRYFGDFSEAQVAETLGCPVGTIKSATSRGLAQMREILEASDEGQSQRPETLGIRRRT